MYTETPLIPNSNQGYFGPTEIEAYGDDYLSFSRIKFSLVISRFQFWTPKRRGTVELLERVAS